MSTSSNRISWSKRILYIAGGAVVFLIVFVLAIRITVTEMFRGIEQSRATGLAEITPWDLRSEWSSGGGSSGDDLVSPGKTWVSRSADLRTRTSSFDRSVAALHSMVSTHNGYFEDLRTESRSGRGRALGATLAVPSNDFDATLSDLKTLGRIESVSQTGEDSAIKLASAGRHLDATRINLSRLQKFQQGRKGELRDAVALEKDISQASGAVAAAERQREELLSTVARARIHIVVIENFRAPLEANLAGSFLSLRNSLIDGIDAVFSSAALFLGVLLEFGLPLLFWLTLLYWPIRLIWRRFHMARVA